MFVRVSQVTPKSGVRFLAFLEIAPALIERVSIEGRELFAGGWQFPNLGDQKEPPQKLKIKTQ